MFASDGFAEGNFFFHAARGIFERDFEIVAQVGAIAAAIAATTAAEEFLENATAATAAASAAEDFAENVERIVKATAATAGTPLPYSALLESGVAVTIISGTFLRVFQDLIRLGNFLKSFLRLFVTRVFVGVILNGFFPISFLQIFVGRTLSHTEQFVVIFFGHMK